MRRFLVLALLSVGALIAFAAVPAVPIHSPLAGFSNAAQASIRLNSSRSNIYRKAGRGETGSTSSYRKKK